MIARILFLMTIVLSSSYSTSAQDNKKVRIKELLNLTHQDSSAIKKFEDLSRTPSVSSSEYFSDSSTQSILSTYIKDTTLLNNMKDIMKDTAYKSLIESFKNIYAAKEQTSKEEIKQVAIKFVNEDIVEMYDRQFSLEEINDMIKFYKTGVGQKLVLLMPELQSEIRKAIEKRYMTYMKSQGNL